MLDLVEQGRCLAPACRRRGYRAYVLADFRRVDVDVVIVAWARIETWPVAQSSGRAPMFDKQIAFFERPVA